MATRTNDLTEFAKPIADELANRCGSLKRVLSAGVLALKDLKPEKREFYMAKAIGEEMELPQNPEEEFRKRVRQVLDELEVLPVKSKREKRAKSSKSA